MTHIPKGYAIAKHFTTDQSEHQIECSYCQKRLVLEALHVTDAADTAAELGWSGTYYPLCEEHSGKTAAVKHIVEKIQANWIRMRKI